MYREQNINTHLQFSAITIFCNLNRYALHNSKVIIDNNKQDIKLVYHISKLVNVYSFLYYLGFLQNLGTGGLRA